MWEILRRYVRDHRPRIAGLVLTVFVVIVAVDLSRTVPRETRLHIDLGPGHDAVRAVELAYTCGDEAVENARHRYPEGAPARLTDTLDLVPGHYQVRLDLTYADGHAESREGQFEAPGEGTVVVSWRRSP